MTQLGYALAMTQTEAILWRYVQGTGPADHTRPLHIKLLHPSSSPRHPLPLGILVPTSAEPALLVVMPTSGKVTYWESLSSAASADSHRQKQQSVQGIVNGLLSREVVTKITEAEPRGFVLTLSTGRLAHLMVSDPQGKLSINVQFMRDSGAQSGGVFGSLRSVFSSAGWRKDVAAVRAGRSWQRGQRFITVATTMGSFQTWDLSWNGTHTLVNEADAKNDMLQALVEGAEDLKIHEERVFEVLDFTMLPVQSSGKEVAKLDKSGDCKIMALTTLKGINTADYALIGLTLASNAVTIDVVHPITCYKTSRSLDTDVRPQVLVPEPAQTAFVIFEKSVVLVSLAEAEETPSSQLQIEAHTLPDPFQDVIDFHKSKPYRVVGCAPEASERGQTKSSCILVIYGFGLIRVSALPVKEGRSALNRAAVTAKTKIEQAVFFGGLQQDLLDFTPRTEISFTHEEVEAAALSVSHSIMDSTSVYIPAISPSMEQTLQRRSTVLADLNKHLRQHYPPLSRLTKWKLLWNAEKMASAKAIWRCYNSALSNPYKGSDKRTLLFELFECMHESMKTENQPELHETDPVRHWFIKDVWRLEHVLPWAQNVVETLFEHSVKIYQKIDQATQARFVSEANDIQLAALETAFRFREANAAVYGLEDEQMVDGVLLQGYYADLPEFWTSHEITCQRVKALTDVSRELARLNEDNDGGEGEPSPELIVKLAADNPRQVQIFCQTWTERFRWLMSRPDPESKARGELYMRSYFEGRSTLLASLCDIGQPDEGFRLAEKYHDMDALVLIIEQEMDSVETDELAQPFEERIDEYFLKFGVPWANAFFKRHLDGGKAVEVLNNNTSYKKHLTHFLRHHSQYSKLAWINEVAAEQSYVHAADHLQVARENEKYLWSRKIALSMGKLTIMAAIAKGQIKKESGEAAIKSLDEEQPIVAAQEKLYKYIKPTIQDALDAEAETDLAMQKYGSVFVKDKPTLRKALGHSMSRMLAMENLPAANLIDLLTLMDDEGLYPDEEGFMDTRFFSALKVLRQSTSDSTANGAMELEEKIIWRRCIIQDNWEEINRTELKDDTQVEVETGATSLFKTLREGYRTGFWDKHPPPPPTALLEAGTTVESLQTSIFHTDWPESAQAIYAKDLVSESELLQEYLEKGRLEIWWKGVLDAAQKAARIEADEDGAAKAKRRQVELQLKLRLRKKDREALPKQVAEDREMEVDDHQGDAVMGI